MEFLEFELPIKEVIDQIDKYKSKKNESALSKSKTYKALQKKLAETKNTVYGNLTPWQKVQLSRHPSRPYTLDYINNILGDTFLELHGDRNISDDKAMIGGLGKIDKQTFMVIGTQKGSNTKMRQYRNFGMSNPEGYRKALRLMKKAEKFNIPVISFIDTPGAYPGIEAEERGQSEAIARNLLVMSELKSPIIATVIGEGGSGGALAIGVADHLSMLQYSIYSVISPEGCASILWKSADKAQEAAQSLGIDSKRLKELGLIDRIIDEPLGGAHRDYDDIAKRLKLILIEELEKLSASPISQIVNQRQERLRKIGKFEDN